MSQRGSQPRGRRRLETTMSALAQARVNAVQSISVAERVASNRHSVPSFLTSATQASLEQSL